MKMHRSIVVALLVALASGISFAAAPDAAWPAKPIHFIVPFPAGGQLDVVARLIAERVSPVLGQPIVVEAKPGADGNIGTELVAKAAPDGYTWLAASPPTTIQPSVRPKTLQEFVAYAKSKPGALSYGGSARGTVVHLATELLMHDTGIVMEMIGYKGQPSAIPDLITARVQFMTLGLILAEPHIKANELRPLAILDATRHAHLPDVPTVVELGHPDLVMSTWFGLAMPKGTPKAIVDRVNAEVMKVLATPDVVARLQGMGIDPAKPNTPADFGRLMRDDVARWKKVVTDAKIVLD
jgi:tripartite-type tricarboxylate transporter receptor subunit TctC